MKPELEKRIYRAGLKENTFKVALLGPDGVAKDSLFEKLTGEVVENNNTVNPGSTKRVVDLGENELYIWEMPDSEAAKSLYFQWLRGAEGALIVYDVDSNFEEYINIVGESIDNPSIALICTKDYLDDYGIEQLGPDIANKTYRTPLIGLRNGEYDNKIRKCLFSLIKEMKENREGPDEISLDERSFEDVYTGYREKPQESLIKLEDRHKSVDINPIIEETEENVVIINGKEIPESVIASALEQVKNAEEANAVIQELFIEFQTWGKKKKN